MPLHGSTVSLEDCQRERKTKEEKEEEGGRQEEV